VTTVIFYLMTRFPHSPHSLQNNISETTSLITTLLIMLIREIYHLSFFGSVFHVTLGFGDRIF